MKRAHNLLRAALVLIALIFSSFPALSQDFWRPVNGPYTATIRIAEVDSEGNIFAGPFRSLDNGMTWEQFTIENVSSIEVDSENNVYLGSHSAGLLKSTDHGQTWQSTNHPYNLPIHIIFVPPNKLYTVSGGGIFYSEDSADTWISLMEPPSLVASLIIRPPDTLIAGGSNYIYRTFDHGQSWDSTAVSGVHRYMSIDLDRNLFSCTHSSNGGPGDIYRSQDFGESWEQIAEGYDYSTMAIDDSGYVYAGTYLNGLFRSTDFGETWDANFQEFHDIFHILPTGNGELYIGTRCDGVRYSSDNGNSWTGIGPKRPQLMKIAASVDGYVYAGNEPEGVYRTDDGGKTWTITRLKAFNFKDMAINSMGNVYVAGRASGIFLSLDHGANWEMIVEHYYLRAIDININDDIYLGTDRGGVFRSTDNGNTWIHQGISSSDQFAFSPNGYIYAFWEMHLYRSVENTNTFELVHDFDYVLRCIATDSTGLVYAHTSIDNDLLISYDDGESWTSLGLGYKYIYEITVDQNDFLYLSTGDDGVLVSADKGNNWISVSSGLPPSLKVRSLTFDTLGYPIAEVWTSNDQGNIYKSNFIINGSTSFWPGDLDNNGLVEAADILPLIDNWYAEVPERINADYSWQSKTIPTWGENLPYSSDADGSGRVDIQDLHVICFNWGRSHEIINSPNYLDNFDVEANRATLEFIYDQVKDSQSGPQYEIGQFIASLIFEPIPLNFSLHPNYPNPFNSNTNIRYDIPVKSQVTITIYDVLGREVKSLVSGIHEAGKYEIVWNGDNNDDEVVSSGLYYYIMETDELNETRSMILLK
ncbi:MAG: T9SS type A sorting domain-containing protein [candidate division Zixibacteria bacterium]|nr:T9SS type A sorting domain-containing protein [candidate division Zixibacteria bacterium]